MTSSWSFILQNQLFYPSNITYTVVVLSQVRVSTRKESSSGYVHTRNKDKTTQLLSIDTQDWDLSFVTEIHDIHYLLPIPQSFDWLAAFHLESLQAILFIAVYLSSHVFLATCFKYCSRGLPTAFFFPNIAPSRLFTTNSLCLIVCPIHQWRQFFFFIFKSNLFSFWGFYEYLGVPRIGYRPVAGWV